MLSGGETVVVAVSGGPDSMALLHLLRRLRDELALRLRVVHVDHGLHRASRAHAVFVASTARRWGIPVSTRRVDVRAHASRLRLTVEESARALRYAALSQVARRVGATHIAVGHTAEDQAETVLLWLLRGAGAGALAGMPPARPHNGLYLIRPLSDLWRDEILGYLAAEGVPYRADPTNRLRRPLRNRIRHDLMPRLMGYNPGVKAVLLRLAEQVADDAALLERLADDATHETLLLTRGRASIAAERFRALPVSLQRRVAYRAAVGAGGNTRRLAFVHMERLRAMADPGRVGDCADLPGLRAEREAEFIVVERARRRPARRMLQ
jgi:tRNA(Ile)-lysidine synthase